MRRLLPASLLLAALLGAAGLSERLAPPPDRPGALRARHEEGRAKRSRALAAALSRASAGRAALAPEGGSRGYDVLTYDLAFTLDPGVVSVDGRAVIRIAAVTSGLAEVRLDLDDAMTVRSVARDGRPLVGWTASGDVLRVPLDHAIEGNRRESA